MRTSTYFSYRTDRLVVHSGDRLAVLRKGSSGAFEHTADFNPDDQFVEAYAQFLEQYAAEHGGYVNDLVDLEQEETA